MTNISHYREAFSVAFATWGRIFLDNVAPSAAFCDIMSQEELEAKKNWGKKQNRSKKRKLLERMHPFSLSYCTNGKSTVHLWTKLLQAYHLSQYPVPSFLPRYDRALLKSTANYEDSMLTIKQVTRIYTYIFGTCGKEQPREAKPS